MKNKMPVPHIWPQWMTISSKRDKPDSANWIVQFPIIYHSDLTWHDGSMWARTIPTWPWKRQEKDSPWSLRKSNLPRPDPKKRELRGEGKVCGFEPWVCVICCAHREPATRWLLPFSEGLQYPLWNSWPKSCPSQRSEGSAPTLASFWKLKSHFVWSPSTNH